MTNDQLMQWLDDHKGNGFKMPDGSIIPNVVMKQFNSWKNSDVQRFKSTCERQLLQIEQWLEEIARGDLNL